MTWKRWLVVIALAILVIKAPHTVISVLHSIGTAGATFWDSWHIH